MTVLKRGDKGKEVKRLQEKLIELGYDLGRFGADGDFGSSTESAVKQWEQDTHVTGVVDQQDLDILFAQQARVSDIPHGFEGLVEAYGKPWLDPQAWWREWGAAANIGLEFAHVIKPRKIGGVLGCFIWVNRDIVQDIESIFSQIAAEGLAGEVYSYDGCFNVRKIRGHDDLYSTHSFAVSIDLNAKTNGLGVEGDMHPRIIEIFKQHGWVCGADFRRKDFMHFQRVTGY